MTITVYRTFKFRLLPSRKQHKVLREICESQRQLYNAALQERIDCFNKTGKGRSYADQCKALTELRKEPEFGAFPVMLQRWTLRRLDDAFQAFFDRVKRGERPGFPRFRGSAWWDSFGFNEYVGGGIHLDDKRLRFKLMPGSLRIHMHRSLPEDAQIKSCVFRREPKGWYISLQCAVPLKEVAHNGADIGVHIDLAEELATLSTGETIPAPQVARRVARELRRRRRAWKRCHKGSRGRRKAMSQVTRLQKKIGSVRSTYLHQQSAKLARQHRLIAVEDLKQVNLLPKAKADAAWGHFLNMLTYKAESAGGELIRVNPKHVREPDPRRGAVVAQGHNAGVHERGRSGSDIDPSRTTALNILALAVTGRGQGNAADSRKRSARNLISDQE